MNRRKNKRRLLQRMYDSLHSSYRRYSDEELAWLNAAPVGREFGSNDYERLQTLDLYSWGQLSEQDAMARLGLNQVELAQMLERDGLRPVDVTALKAMFGKSKKHIAIKEMNPLRQTAIA